MSQRSIIVTGASRGIGAATARLLAAQGHAIAVNYRSDIVAAEQVVQSIRDQGGRAIAIQADVAEEAEVLRLFARCDAELGPLYGLVNNAGILRPQSQLADMDGERLCAVLHTNVLGSLLCAREAVRRLSTRFGGSGGVIVNVSSAASRLGSPDEYVDYAASKGAIDSLTLGLAKEVGPQGIRVNAVRPGFINTDIHASGGEANRIQRIQGSIPLRRGGSAEEVAQLIAWLISDQASYTSGALIDIAGGR